MPSWDVHLNTDTGKVMKFDADYVARDDKGGYSLMLDAPIGKPLRQVALFPDSAVLAIVRREPA